MREQQEIGDKLPSFHMYDDVSGLNQIHEINNNEYNSLENNLNPNDDLVKKENLCGYTLVTFQKRGKEILNNIMNLSVQVPDIFLNDPSEINKANSYLSSFFFGNTTTSPSSATQTIHDSSSSIPSATQLTNKFQKLLFDFTYLESPDLYEQQISNEFPDSTDIETEFAHQYKSILLQYYNLFESIFLFYKDLNSFFKDIQNGFYIHYTMESLFFENNGSGKTLVCEVVFLYGLLLFLIHANFSGSCREYMIIAFYRYCVEDREENSHSMVRNFESVCKLFSKTNTSNKNRLLPSQSTTTTTSIITLFSRYTFPTDFLKNVIGHLISDDIYSQSSLIFPHLNHRSYRYSRQASMLYIMLYFHPLTLQEEMSTMREIVDKFFYNNWVISIHMGIIVDLSLDWEPYYAARTALNNVMSFDQVQKLYKLNLNSLLENHKQIKSILSQKELLLSEDYLLEHTPALLHILRKANFSLHWRLLHIYQNKQNLKCRYIAKDFSLSLHQIMDMLLQLSELEYQLKLKFQNILDHKQQKWELFQLRAKDTLLQIAHYFSTTNPMLSTTFSQSNEGISKKYDKFASWFHNIAQEIHHTISYQYTTDATKKDTSNNTTITGRKIHSYIQALEDIQYYDTIENCHIQIKISIKEVMEFLRQMIRVVNIPENVVTLIDWIGDVSYMWRNMITDFIVPIQDMVVEDPKNILMLKSFFWKLATSSNFLMFRLSATSSTFNENKENTGLDQFYSAKLENFCRAVLECVPTYIFSIIQDIAKIIESACASNTTTISITARTKIEVDNLPDYAESSANERCQLTKYFYYASMFNEAILSFDNMQHVLQVDIYELIDIKIRNDFVQEISKSMHALLQFPFYQKTTLLIDYRTKVESQLSKLQRKMYSLKRAFEYIQDYITGIVGLGIWLEETARIISFNQEREANRYLLDKISETESIYQSTSIPIPSFTRSVTDTVSANFLGRTMVAFLRLTDFQKTIYSQDYLGWFLQSGTEVCGVRSFARYSEAMTGVGGLFALDHLFSVRIAYELQRFYHFYNSTIKTTSQSSSSACFVIILEQIRDELFPEWNIPHAQARRIIASARRRLEKLITPLLFCFSRIGQAQLIRKMIRMEMKISSRSDVLDDLYSSIATLNNVVVREALLDLPSDEQSETSFLRKVVNDELYLHLINCIGEGTKPIETVFNKAESLEGLSVLLSIFIISFASKAKLDNDFDSLVPHNSSDAYPFDGWPIIAGVATILKQYHASYLKSVFVYLGLFVRSMLYASTQQILGTNTYDDEEDDDDLSGGDYSYQQQLQLQLLQIEYADGNIMMEVKNVIVFTLQLCSICNVNRTALYEFIPEYLIEMIR